VLLLDEPLSNLDAKLRQEMRVEIAEIQKRLRITTVFVTHDQEEALVIADRVAVMRDGVVEQVDTPTAIYGRPRTPFVARFIGDANFLPGCVRGRDGAHVVVETDVGVRVLAADDAPRAPGARVVAMVRPEKVRVTSEAAPAAANAFPAKLRSVAFTGALTRYHLELGASSLLATRQDGADLPAWAPGASVCASWRPADCLLLEEPG
jgi:ABC-type Fe3+/spermidine/putrescine transport system ATPase subunit